MQQTDQIAEQHGTYARHHADDERKDRQLCKTQGRSVIAAWPAVGESSIAMVGRRFGCVRGLRHDCIGH